MSEPPLRGGSTCCGIPPEPSLCAGLALPRLRRPFSDGADRAFSSAALPLVRRLPSYRPPARQSVSGRLVVESLSPEDVVQGQLGMCYFFVALSSLASRNPELIRSMMNPVSERITQVTFPDRPHETFRVDLEDIVGGDNRGRGEHADLWPWVLADAWAQRAGGVTDAQGGYVEHVLEALTGAPGKRVLVREQDSDHLWRHLNAGVSERDDSSWEAFVERPMAFTTHYLAATSFIPSAGVFERTLPGYPPMHSFSVVAVGYDRSGERYVVVRNPWALDLPKSSGPDPANDGIIRVPYRDVLAAMRWFHFTECD
ncbi:MAG: C2 family cysteine protease, partial [Myxococcota bacterium]